MNRPILADQLEMHVTSILSSQTVVDMHTHLYPPSFGTPVPNRTVKVDPTGYMLWGVDELVTYHYLIAELYRVITPEQVPYAQFWKMSRSAQADLIWQKLFIERTPVSEACRGVLTTLRKLGLDTGKTRDLPAARKWFAEQDPSDYIDKVMQIANVESITMTNPVFDDNERNRWLSGTLGTDPRFTAVLRIDPMLRSWPEAGAKIASWGYGVGPEMSDRVIEEAKRFLRDWIDRQKAIYLAVSLGPEFRYPVDASADEASRQGQIILQKVVLPVCAERGLPFAMMIGSTRGVNPSLGDAGDMLGKSDVSAVVTLCREFPKNKFFVTMLSRENQHELCVAARKFGNLMVFGCWWFLNNPSLIEEITRMRLELLGTSMIPQHSDARILDQLVYKWDHSRKIIGKVLVDKYRDLMEAGWGLTRSEIERDARQFLKENFLGFLKR